MSLYLTCCVIFLAIATIILLIVFIKNKKLLETAEKNLQETKNSLEAKNAELDDTKNKIQILQSDFNANKKNLEETQNNLENNKKLLVSTEKNLQETKNSLEAKNAELDDTKNKIQILQSDFNANKKNLAETQNNLENSKKLLVSTEKNLQETTNSLETKKEELKEEKDKIDFIAKVISTEPETHDALEEFKKLLAEDYQKYANDTDSLAEEAEALLKLQKVEKTLETLSFDKSLLNKNMVAIAGAFSSGKSSFMNTFFTSKEMRLPSGMTQTTAISAYVMDGEPSITGFSFKGGRVDISKKMFELFSHDKKDEFNFNMKQIMSHIVFRNNFIEPFKHLCFIDTPGFNPGSDSASDYDAAISAVAQASAVLWCFSMDQGIIKDDAMSILKDIYYKNENIKIYIVANRADLKSIDESSEIIDEVEEELNSNDIRFEGMTLYKSKRPSSYENQPEEYAEYTKGKSLKEFLQEIDTENKQAEKDLLHQVEEVFDSYITADNTRIKRLTKNLNALNKLEFNFSEIVDKKDEEILYYKARMDHAKWGKKQFENSKDEQNEDDDFFNNMAEIKQDLQTRIKNDKKNIEVAKDLCTKMCKSIVKVFGYTSYSLPGKFHRFAYADDVGATSDGIDSAKKEQVQKMASIFSTMGKMASILFGTVQEKSNTINDAYDFIMPIETVSSFSDKGSFVKGHIQKGVLNMDDTVKIISDDRTLTATVSVMEMHDMLLDIAKEGDDVGILLHGVSKDDVSAGMLLVK